jgi:fatty-acyl-CoA synthase
VFEWVVIQYATARIGAILVNINPAFKTRELEFTVNQSKIQLLLHAGTFRETDYAEIIKRILPSCSALHTTINLDSHWKDLLTQVSQTTNAELSQREETLDFDDPINIQYTSGTTGSPKGATLSHHNILNNGYFCGEILGYTHADRVVIPMTMPKQ